MASSGQEPEHGITRRVEQNLTEAPRPASNSNPTGAHEETKEDPLPNDEEDPEFNNIAQPLVKIKKDLKWLKNSIRRMMDQMNLMDKQIESLGDASPEGGGWLNRTPKK